MIELNFYRGKKEKYDQMLYGDGIYFTTDTLEIIHDSQSYAYTPSKDLIGDLIDGNIKDIVLEDDGQVTYSVIRKETNGTFTIQSGIKFPVAIAGFASETGTIRGGQHGLMSPTDKYNLDTLISDESTEGSVKNTINDYLSWIDVNN